MTATNKKFFEIWGLRILSLIIAVIIALVFYVRFYQSFLGDWQSAAWAALAVSIGSVIVTGYAIAAFKLDMASVKNRMILATLWIFAIGLFMFDRATETYTMQSRKTEKETNTTNARLAAIDSLPILNERLKAVRDANTRLAMLDQREKKTGWLYVTLRREAQRERKLADSLYHLERSQQIEIIQAQGDKIRTAGIAENGLGFVVKNWPSAALGLVVLGLLVAAYWKETELNPAGQQGSVDNGTTTLTTPDLILPPKLEEEDSHQYRWRVAQMYARGEFPTYVNQTYLAGRLKIRKGTMSKLVNGKLGNRKVSKYQKTETAQVTIT